MGSRTLTQRIILASTSEQENLILRRKIEGSVKDMGPIQYVSVRPQGIHSAIDESVSIVMLNVPAFNAMSKVVISDARRIGYDGPILVLSKVDSPELMHDVRNAENVVLLEKPYEVKDLQGIARKFILARNVAQRIHRRYSTVQRAEVEVPQRKMTIMSTLFNLSRGGAYFEFPNIIDVKVGDVLKMKIELSEVNRTYAMPARIVWTTPMGFSGGHGVGVEFLGRANVRGTPLGI